VFGLITHRREDIIRHSPELYVALRVGESLLLATTSLGSRSADSPLCAVCWNTVGFSGSIATYATWTSQSFQAVSGFKDPSRSWLHNVCPSLSSPDSFTDFCFCLKLLSLGDRLRLSNPHHLCRRLLLNALRRTPSFSPSLETISHTPKPDRPTGSLLDLSPPVARCASHLYPLSLFLAHGSTRVSLTAHRPSRHLDQVVGVGLLQPQ
jgi:hypothetical protein